MKTTIKERNGNRYVMLLRHEDDENVTTMVPRLSRHVRAKCRHIWTYVANQGHGKWRRGCLKCGALGR